VWWPRVLSGRSADAYGALLGQIGTLPAAALYVLGASAACTHFAQGLSAVLLRNGVFGMSSLVARSIAVLIGVLLWVILIDELMAYATGAPLL
jgi:hypothetical protein